VSECSDGEKNGNGAEEDAAFHIADGLLPQGLLGSPSKSLDKPIILRPRRSSKIARRLCPELVRSATGWVA